MSAPSLDTYGEMTGPLWKGKSLETKTLVKVHPKTWVGILCTTAGLTLDQQSHLLVSVPYFNKIDLLIQVLGIVSTLKTYL